MEFPSIFDNPKCGKSVGTDLKHNYNPILLISLDLTRGTVELFGRTSQLVSLGKSMIIRKLIK
jgi:hypothetical protein